MQSQSIIINKNSNKAKAKNGTLAEGGNMYKRMVGINPIPNDKKLLQSLKKLLICINNTPPFAKILA